MSKAKFTIFNKQKLKKMAESNIVTFVTIVKGQREVSKNDTRTARKEAFDKLFGGKHALKHSHIVKLSDEHVQTLDGGGTIDVAELTASGDVAKAIQENKLLKADKEAQEKAIAEKTAENEKLNAKLNALLNEIQAKKAKPEADENGEGAKPE